ncbi:MAG: PAS domain S-box protein [Candidatus Competibacter sp.]
MANRNLSADGGGRTRAFDLPTAADLAEIVQRSDDAIIVVDESRRIVFFNDGARDLFGYESAEILGKPLEHLLPARHQDPVRRLIADVRRSAEEERRTPARETIAGARRDGSEFPAEISIARLPSTERPDRLTVIVRDLTERERIERQFRLKSDALENSLTAFGIANIEGRLVYANRSHLNLWGYESLDEIVAAPIASHCVDPSVPARIAGAVERNGQCTLEFTARRKDGSTFEALISVRKAIDESGDEIYVGTALDLTERKQAEAKLAEQKDLLEIILQQAAEAIVVCNAQDNPILINAAARRLALGGGRNDAESSPKFLWGKAYYPDGHPIPLQAWPLQQALRGNTTVGAEARVIRPDGSYYDVLISAAPIRNADQRIIGAVAIFSDITERKRVEEKLLYQLRLTQGITDSATDSIFVTDADGRATFLNPEAQKVFGFAPEEIIGTALHDTIHHHYQDGRPMPINQCPLGRIHATGETVRDYEDVFFRKDGSNLTMSCSNALLESKGKRVGAVFFMRDITERRRSEQALRESAARLRAIVNAVPDVLLVLDEDGRYVEILSQTQLLYTDPAVLKGRLIADVLPADVTEHALRVIRQTLATRQPQSFEYEIPIRKLGKRNFEARTAPLDGLPLGKPSVVLLARDITQQRSTEASLRHAQKMEAVGQLTGGVAHDFNNLLAVILGNLELLAEALTDPAQAELVQRALSAVERGTTLIRRLLTFSRQQPLQPVPVNLNTLIAGISDLLRRSLGETIEIETVLANNLLPDLDRSRRVRSGPVESGGQRAGCHAYGRAADPGNGQSLAGRGRRAPAELSGRSRSVRHAGGDRHRLRDVSGRSRTRLRAVLYHQGSGPGQRARAQHGLRAGQAVGRPHPDFQRSGSRHLHPHLPAGGPGARRPPDRGGRQRGIPVSRPGSNDPGGRGRTPGAPVGGPHAARLGLRDPGGGYRCGGAGDFGGHAENRHTVYGRGAAGRTKRGRAGAAGAPAASRPDDTVHLGLCRNPLGAFQGTPGGQRFPQQTLPESAVGRQAPRPAAGRALANRIEP